MASEVSAQALVASVKDMVVSVKDMEDQSGGSEVTVAVTVAVLANQPSATAEEDAAKLVTHLNSSRISIKLLLSLV